MLRRLRPREAALGVVVLVAALLACKKKDALEAAPSASAAPVATGPCKSGATEDPDRGELKPALTALDEQQYDTAETLLENMRKKYPNSATVRVWRAETALFNEKKTYVQRADDAIPFYEEALKLHEDGCTLEEGSHYYLRWGFALAYLRKEDAEKAMPHLEVAKKNWGNSAEVHYNLARAHCMKKDVDACADALKECFRLAKALQRPKFLRNHNSIDDWVRRSRTQSEFRTTLHKDFKRYNDLLKYAKSDE